MTHQYINSMEEPYAQEWDDEQCSQENCRVLWKDKPTEDLSAAPECSDIDYDTVYAWHCNLMFAVKENRYKFAHKALSRAKERLSTSQFTQWIDQSNELAEGHSALTSATENNFTTIVELLISFGANPRTPNANKQSAIAIAKIRSAIEEDEGQYLLEILCRTAKLAPMAVYPKAILKIMCEEQMARSDDKFQSASSLTRKMYYHNKSKSSGN